MHADVCLPPVNMATFLRLLEVMSEVPSGKFSKFVEVVHDLAMVREKPSLAARALARKARLAAKALLQLLLSDLRRFVKSG